MGGARKPPRPIYIPNQFSLQTTVNVTIGTGATTEHFSCLGSQLETYRICLGNGNIGNSED